MSDSNNAMKDDVSAFDKGLEEWDNSAFDRGMQDYDLEQKRVEASQPDTLDDFLTGAIRGGTLGFSEEIGAALDILRGRAPSDAKSLSEAYNLLRKQREAENEAAVERSPIATTAGELIGGFAVPIPGAMATGLGKVTGLEKLLSAIGFKGKSLGHISSGAAVGGLAGLGTSKGSLTEEPGEVAKDIGISALGGGALGLGLGTAADKVSEAWKKFINTPGGKKMVASFEMSEGKRPGYEGEQISSMETPSIHPEEQESGLQKVITKRTQLADELTEDAVNMQAQAKDQLNAAIDRNRGVPARPEEMDELNQSLNDWLPQEVYNKSIDEFYDLLPDKIKNQIRLQIKSRASSNKEPLTVNQILSNLTRKGPLGDQFGDIYDKNMSELTVKYMKELADQIKTPEINDYVNGLSRLIEISRAPKGSELYNVKQVLKSIDPFFVKNVRNSPLDIKVDELFKFRRKFLKDASAQALDKNLTGTERELLFGIKDPSTGKYQGGVFNAIENVLKNSSEDLKSIINNVDKKSRHIEVLLNAHPDEKFHGAKAWDFDRAEDLRRTVQGSFSNAINKARSGTMQGAEEATLLRNYFKTMLDNASSPEEAKLLSNKIDSFAEKVAARSEEVGSMTERVGVDPTEGIKAGKFDPTTIPGQAKQSNISKLAEIAGSTKRSVEKTAGEIPAIVRVPVREGVKLPFTFKNATEEQLKKAAEILKASNIPSVKQFGEGISESATNNPAVRNAIIHSAYQKEEIRKALGLTLNKDEEK